MSLLSLVWNYLKARALNTALNILLLALGIAVITLLILFSRQAEEKISVNTRGIDLVVGAKGSPLQLILCNIFQIDFPTGNIKLSEAEKISRHSLVKKAIPLALGDSYRGFRIVGTTHAYTNLYHAELASGTLWQSDLDVTLGATVAKISGLMEGDTFASAHGLASDGHDHEENLYRVTGILKPAGNVIDNVILTNIESIWKVHHLSDSSSLNPTRPSPLVSSVEAGDSIREITSLLIQYRNPLAAIQMPRFVNDNSRLQAASPAFETSRIFSILGIGVGALRGFAGVLIFISGLSIFIALYNSLKDRRYDLAIMRALGAGRMKLFISILMEGGFLATAGSAFGIVLGHITVLIFVLSFPEGRKMDMTANVFYGEELYLLGGSILLGVLCSVIPAIQAYRTDIHKVLAGN